ncbi:MAG: carboxylesterase/lipase family protein [Ferruginibacter sp.]|nr:carboxylesterase/lipase family protein [Ferruginibacter sp.]
MIKNIQFILVGLATFFICQSTIAQLQISEADCVVSTKLGKVKGSVINGIGVFKSIPYAAPPIGANRFAAPVAHLPWGGIRDATKQGPTAPFATMPEGDFDSEPTMGKGWLKGDDFLAVNIWTPSTLQHKLPVMVYIHGGAFAIGTSDVPLFDGTNFAKKGVVLVTLNYRMGIEGFLQIPGVPTNIGIRDQIAALKWVKENIAAFGGDPANVTLFGESAGAISVGVLITSKAATGLFKRCIMESGSGQAALSKEQAGIIAAQYAKTLKISNTREAYLRFSPEELLAAQGKVTSKMVKLKTPSAPDPTGGVALFFPIIDGDIITEMPVASIRKNEPANIDLLIGYNTDEMNYFLLPTGLLKKIKFNFILNRAVLNVHPAPSVLIGVFKKAYPKKNLGELFSTILTSYQAQMPSIRFANELAKTSAKIFMYEFAWPSSIKNGVYGAYHGVEMPFVFNNLQSKGDRGMLGPDGGPQALADKMQDAWVSFAKAGNPGWDAYTTRERKTMLINNTWQLQTNPHEKILAAWDGVREY